jgi:hypothetical protein
MSKQRKAIILYASRGGNTEKFALKFKEVIGKKGRSWGDWECDSLKITRHTDWNNLPFTPKDEYDFVCVGSPVIDGIPASEIFHGRGLMLLMPKGLDTSQGFAPITEPFGMKKGIVFVTYTDGRRGTAEAIPALDCLELRIEDMRIKCIGKFACTCGPVVKYRFESPNIIAAKFKVSLDEADDLLQRYKENPEYPEFAKLSQEERSLFEKETTVAPEALKHHETSGARDLIWDVHNKPSKRDLLKAEIFLEEILENFYGGEIEAAPLCQHLCIA